MASPMECPNKVTLWVLLGIVFLIISAITFLSPKPAVAAGSVFSSSSSSSSSSSRSSATTINRGDNTMLLLQQQRKLLVLGSRPPQCVNKCYNCRPCMATLVIPPHHQLKKKKKASAAAVSSSSPSPILSNYNRNGDHVDEQDDNYYLLTWKCRCGNKLYHP